MKGDQIPAALWKAIASNDRSYDNQFFYAIATTGIFCKPSCRSRVPNKKNVSIFFTVTEAMQANFRPCKRCKPTDKWLPDEAWVKQITEYINKRYAEPLSLQRIAEECHGSPHHLHRTFKRIKGLTPSAYIQQRRIEQAVEYLQETNLSIQDIARSVGIPNTPYFITLFKKRTGNTPNEYRVGYRHAYMDKGATT